MAECVSISGARVPVKAGRGVSRAGGRGGPGQRPAGGGVEAAPGSRGAQWAGLARFSIFAVVSVACVW